MGKKKRAERLNHHWSPDFARLCHSPWSFAELLAGVVGTRGSLGRLQMSALVFTWYLLVHFLVFWCFPIHESISPTTELFIQLFKTCPVPKDAELLTKLILCIHKPIFFLEQAGLMLSNKYWSCSLGVSSFFVNINWDYSFGGVLL